MQFAIVAGGHAGGEVTLPDAGGGIGEHFERADQSPIHETDQHERTGRDEREQEQAGAEQQALHARGLRLEALAEAGLPHARESVELVDQRVRVLHRLVSRADRTGLGARHGTEQSRGRRLHAPVLLLHALDLQSLLDGERPEEVQAQAVLHRLAGRLELPALRLVPRHHGHGEHGELPKHTAQDGVGDALFFGNRGVVREHACPLPNARGHRDTERQHGEPGDGQAQEQQATTQRSGGGLLGRVAHGRPAPWAVSSCGRRTASPSSVKLIGPASPSCGGRSRPSRSR